MEYRFLGNTGLKVSELALGTQTFGWGADEKTANALADLFVRAGGNLFDTADSYNNGVSESMLGSWLKARKNRHEEEMNKLKKASDIPLPYPYRFIERYTRRK